MRLPLILAGLAFTLAGVLGAVSCFWAPKPPAAPCGREQVVIAEDGERLALTLYRCEAREGRHPALLVWSGDGARAERHYLAALDDFAREGRSLILAKPAEGERPAAADLRALVLGIAEDPAIDPRRVAAVVTGPLVAALDAEEAELPGELALLVLVDEGGAEPVTELDNRRLRLSARSARRAAPQVREALGKRLLGEVSAASGDLGAGS